MGNCHICVSCLCMAQSNVLDIRRSLHEIGIHQWTQSLLWHFQQIINNLLHHFFNKKYLPINQTKTDKKWNLTKKKYLRIYHVHNNLCLLVNNLLKNIDQILTAWIKICLQSFNFHEIFYGTFCSVWLCYQIENANVSCFKIQDNILFTFFIFCRVVLYVRVWVFHGIFQRRLLYQSIILNHNIFACVFSSLKGIVYKIIKYFVNGKRQLSGTLIKSLGSNVEY